MSRSLIDKSQPDLFFPDKPSGAICQSKFSATAGATGYGYQWWVPDGAEEGEFLARGIYGQYIYINRLSGVVVAINSADRGFREAGSYDSNIAMFRKIAAAYR